MKKVSKLLFALLLCTLCFAAFMVVNASAADEAGNVAYIGETGYATLEAAMKAVQKDQTIKLVSDATLPAGTTELYRGGNYIVDGAKGDDTNYTITLEGGDDGSRFQFAGSQVVEFRNVTVDLNKRHFLMRNTAHIILGEGTIWKNGQGANGGAICGNGDTPTVTMKPGSIIRDCYSTGGGGAVLLQSGQTLILEGGTITSCKADGDGGAVNVSTGAVVKLSGDATVTGNTSTRAGGASNINLPNTQTGIEIQVIGSLTGEVGVYMKNVTPANGLTFATVAEDVTGLNCLVCDNNSALRGYAQNSMAIWADDSIRNAVAKIGETYYATLYEAMGAAGSNVDAPTRITMMRDATLEAKEGGNTLYNAAGKCFIVDGNGYTITVVGGDDATEKDKVFIFWTRVTYVEFQHVTIDLNRRQFRLNNNNGGTKMVFGDGTLVQNGYGQNGGAVLVNAKNELVMKSGSTIQNCEATSGGGAVLLLSDGIFTMEGGTIMNCHANGSGGGINAADGSKLYLSGDATVTDCTSITKNPDGYNNINLNSADELHIVGNLTGTVGVTVSSAANGMQFATMETGVTGLEKLVCDNDKTLYGYELYGVVILVNDSYAAELQAAVAMIGSVPYATLDEAIQTVGEANMTILLVKNASMTTPKEWGSRKFILDGQGYTVTLEGGNKGTYLQFAGGTIVEFRNVIVDLNERHFRVRSTAQFILGDGTVLQGGYGANGGAILCDAGGTPTVTIQSGATIQNCTAGNDGGAIYVGAGMTLVVEGGTISSCSATGRGGAIFVASGGRIQTLSETASFTGNTAGSDESDIFLRMPDLSAASVSISDVYSINFKLPASYVEAFNTTSSIVNDSTPTYGTVVLVGPNGEVSYVISTMTPDSDGNYVFIYDEIGPHQMGETVTATVPVNGEDQVTHYSIKTYCTNQLKDDKNKEEFKTMLRDMLHYGAAAQAIAGATEGFVNEDVAATTTKYTPTITAKDFNRTGDSFTGASVNLDNGVTIVLRVSGAETVNGVAVADGVYEHRISLAALNQAYNYTADNGATLTYGLPIYIDSYEGEATALLDALMKFSTSLAAYDSASQN